MTYHCDMPGCENLMNFKEGTVKEGKFYCCHVCFWTKCENHTNDCREFQLAYVWGVLLGLREPSKYTSHILLNL